jgi:hypothetical protein
MHHPRQPPIPEVANTTDFESGGVGGGGALLVIVFCKDEVYCEF